VSDIEALVAVASAARALLDRLDEDLPKGGKRPTIAELEAILASPAGAVEIMPNGEIRSAPREEIEALRTALANLGIPHDQ
jgi:hypothetical protein